MTITGRSERIKEAEKEFDKIYPPEKCEHDPVIMHRTSAGPPAHVLNYCWRCQSQILKGASEIWVPISEDEAYKFRKDWMSKHAS